MTDKNEDTKPKYVIDLTTDGKTKSPSMRQVMELAKQDYGSLSKTDQGHVDHYKTSMSKLSETFSSKKLFGDLFKGISPMSDALKNLTPSPVVDLNFDDIDFVAPPSATEQYKHSALLEQIAAGLQLQQTALDQDILGLVMPRYDKRKHILTFANTPIHIPADTPAEILCKRMFRSGVPVKKPVEKGDLFELLGLMEVTPKTRRVKMLYNRVDGLNTIVAKVTGVDDLFGFVDKKLYFNTKYVKLPL